MYTRQRGTCQNTDGLLPQYLPNGVDLSVFTQQDELAAIADSLNSRLRATHNWRTPMEILGAILANSRQPSDSVH
jgi:IS30 family transposase